MPGGDDDLDPSPESLRRRAEAAIRAEADPTLDKIALGERDEVRKALHQLRVHEIELEMQNEELRRVQEALDAARARYFDLYDLAPVGYCTLGEEGRVVEANLTLARILGTTRSALVRETLAHFVHADDQDTYYKHRRRLAQSGQPQVCELRLHRADGATIWARLESTPGTESEAGGRVVVSDVTSEHPDHAQADRMASMGLLAAGVAHEINNPLTFVLANMNEVATELPRLGRVVGRLRDALRQWVGADELGRIAADDFDRIEPAGLAQLEEAVAQAALGTRRIEEISRGLGSFSRSDEAPQDGVDVNRAVEHAVLVARNEIRFRAALKRDLGSLPPVRASEGRLAQVFLNLLINAAHAIEEGAVGENEISIRTWSDAGEVVAEVRDTGRGIPDDQLEQVFEPFFTTTQRSGGTGLGLAITRRIVREMGGRITIQSRLHGGTRVEVRIPAAPVTAAPAPPAERLPTSSRGRVLIVDDEDGIRRALERILGPAHEVVAVGSGRDAQQLLEQDPDFDVVLCDLMMPDQGGVELHTWLQSARPILAERVVFMTGGVFTPQTREYLERVPNSQIPKPFDIARLRQMVAEKVSAARG